MVRILSYNVHGCRGTDGVLSPHRIAEVIAASGAEVVALQELDVRRRRSGGIDQVEAIALALGMDFHFHPALRLIDEAYGDAVLTTCPMRLVKAGPLPDCRFAGCALEPRGALWVEVTAGGAPLQVINTHLGLLPHEQRIQAACLLGPDWLGHPQCRDPALLVGDLNAPARSGTYRRFAAALRDAAREPAGAGPPAATFPSRRPLMRLDHAFLRGAPRVISVEVIATALARIASDHRPLLVELDLAACSPAAAEPRAAVQPA